MLLLATCGRMGGRWAEGLPVGDASGAWEDGMGHGEARLDYALDTGKQVGRPVGHGEARLDYPLLRW